MLNGRPRDELGQAVGGCARVVGDDHCLDEHLDLRTVICAVSGRSDRLDPLSSRFWAPIDLVTVAVSEGPAKSGDPDDVGVSAGEAKYPIAVAAHQKWNGVPHGPRILQHRIDEAEVLPVVRRRAAGEPPRGGLHQLDHARNTVTCRGKGSARRRPLPAAYGRRPRREWLGHLRPDPAWRLRWPEPVAPRFLR